MNRNMGSFRVFWSICYANRDLSLLNRLSRSYDKMLFYKYHSNKQLSSIIQSANQLQPQKPNLLAQAKNKIQTYSNLVKNKLQEFKPAEYIPIQPQQIDFNTIVNNAQVKSNSQKIFQYILSHSIIFYNSIQALVEGRREVLTNPNLVLWDGETVSQKEQKFEKLVKYFVDKLNAK